MPTDHSTTCHNGRPAVSVVMAVFNGAAFLSDAVESIRCQTFSDWELVIVDDGSTDDTRNILAAHASRDGRIRILRHNENLGLTRSLVHAFEQARGRWIARQDADDLSRPERLGAQVEWFEKTPRAALCGALAEFADEAGRTLACPSLPRDDAAIRRALPFRNCFVHSSVMFSRDACQRAGGYRAFFRYAQDYDLWLRMSGTGTMHNLPVPLVVHRLHGQAISTRRIDEQTHYGGLASALQLAESTFGAQVLPAECLHRLQFHSDRRIDQACRRRYRLFRDLHRMGTAGGPIRTPRWRLIHRGVRSGHAEVAARCVLYALFGRSVFGWLRARRGSTVVT